MPARLDDTVHTLTQRVEELFEREKASTPLRDVLERNDPEAYRYSVLAAHGRGAPVDAEALAEAERRTDYLYTTHDALVAIAGDARPADSNVLQGQAKIVDEAPEAVLAALEEDLATTSAVDAIGALAKACNEIVMQAPKLSKDPARHAALRGLAAKAARALAAACRPLGLMQASSDVYWARTRARRLRLRGLDAASIERKVDERAAARRAKDFARADAIRTQLDEMGVEVFDAGSASTWKIKV